MATPVVDMTSLDFDSLKSAMKRYAQEKYGNEGWTDFNENQFAVMMLDLFCYAGDLSFFQINALTKETIVALLTRDQNLRNIGRYLDYTVPSAVAASGQLTVTFNPANLPFVLSSTFQFGTDDPDNQVIFQPVADQTITVTPATVAVVEGLGFVNELVANSNGAINQQHPLANSPCIDGTLTVFVGGVLWRKTGNAFDSGPLDTTYVIRTDEDDVAQLIFGDGINGLVPPSTQEIRATYKTGGGSRGNVTFNTVTQVVTPSTTVLTCNNVAKMSNGDPKPTVAQSKKALPASLSTLKRAVNETDFASLAIGVSGVAKAVAEAGVGNEVNLYIAPTGGGQPSNILKNTVVSYFRTRKMLGTKINPGGPFYQSLEMELDVKVLNTARQGDTSALVRRKLLNALEFANVDFGGELQLQQLYLLLDPRETQGVDSVVFRTVRGIPAIRSYFNQGNSGNGTFVEPLVEGPVGSYQWEVKVTDTTTSTKVQVTQKQRGVVSDLNDTTITDLTATFIPSDLVGKVLTPDEENPTSQIVITANTASTITVASGLLSMTFKDAGYSIILTTTSNVETGDALLTGPNVGAVIPVEDVVGLGTGARVLLLNASNEVIDRTLMDIGAITTAGLNITLPATLPIALLAGYRVVRPVSINLVAAVSRVTFGLIQGTTPFSVGDKWFFDSFAQLGDIRIRRADIAQLLTEKLTIRAVGGIAI